MSAELSRYSKETFFAVLALAATPSLPARPAVAPATDPPPVIATAAAGATTVAADALRLDAGPLAKKWRVLCDNDPRALATFEHRRPEMPDQSLSAFDLALANAAARAQWSDAEIAALILAHRQKWGDADDIEKGRRPDYLATTIRTARASAAASAPAPDGAAPTIAAIVRAAAVEFYAPVFRPDTPKGAAIFSDRLRRNVPRSEFVQFVSEALVTECMAAADAPKDKKGKVNRRGVIAAIGKELGPIFGTLFMSLPDQVDAAPTTEAAKQFRRDILRIFTKTTTLQRITQHKENTLHGHFGDDVTARASMASRALSWYQKKAKNQQPRGWTRIQSAFDAYCRVGPSGELVLAMHFTLLAQLNLESALPGVHDQKTLNALAEKYGVEHPDSRITRLTSGAAAGLKDTDGQSESPGAKQRRLLVLSPDMTAEIVNAPAPDPEPETPPQKGETQ